VSNEFSPCVVNASDLDATYSSPERVIGRAAIRRLSPALGTEQLQVNAIWLDAGSRYRPHRHHYDQVLYYPTGTGVVAVDGGEDVVVPEGQYVLLPAETVHMHGCTDDAPALQISMMVDTTTEFDVPCPAGWEAWSHTARR
jgi:quercetin dioxygenase-like cupin family protein